MGQFLINANASTLIFDTANANGMNPADLIFRIASTNDSLRPGIRMTHMPNVLALMMSKSRRLRDRSAHCN
jgi:hypothetical protein